MKNEFDERGLTILRTQLPNCVFEKENDVITINGNGKTITIKADFEKLFELIDYDRMSRQIDSGEWYWKLFGNVIKRELI